MHAALNDRFIDTSFVSEKKNIIPMCLRPDPVKWTKDGGKLPDMERVIVDGRDLTFISLNKTDNGTYRCEASNHLGTNHAEYVLYVYGEC